MEENVKNIGYYLQRSRWDCNKSQEFMALELGVARKTVQNWEKGYSEPTLNQFRAWFDALGVSPMPYLIRFFYQGSHDADDITADDEKIKKLLMEMLSDMPPKSVKQFLFVLDGNHGSSPRALLQMVNAHLQTPMKDRFNQASMILQNYELARDQNQLTNSEEVQPDVEFLKRAIYEGRKAVIAGNDEYSMI